MVYHPGITHSSTPSIVWWARAEPAFWSEEINLGLPAVHVHTFGGIVGILDPVRSWDKHMVHDTD